MLGFVSRGMITLFHEITVIAVQKSHLMASKIFKIELGLIGLKNTSMTLDDTSVLRVFTVPKQKRGRKGALIVEESEKVLKLIKTTVITLLVKPHFNTRRI